MKDFIYYGAFIFNEGKAYLFKYLKEHNMLPEEEYKLFLDHCTLLHVAQMNNEENESLKEALDYNVEHLEGKTLVMGLDAIGRTDKAMAFRVYFGVDQICANETPHVTICTFANGKPVDSNQITEWKPLEEPIFVDVELRKIKRQFS